MKRNFLIFIFLFQSSLKGMITERQLVSKNEEVFKKIYKNIIDYYKQKFPDDDFQITKEPSNINELKEGFIFKFGQENNKNFEIQAKVNKVKPKTIDLYLINPIEQLRLELSHFNMRETTDADLIEDKYIGRFFDKIKQFDFDEDQIFKECIQILQDVMTTKFNLLEDGDDAEQEDENSKSIIKYFQYSTPVGELGTDMRRDLKVTLTIDQDQIMYIKTQFYNGQFKILAPTQEFLQSTLTPIFTKVRDHYERYLIFNRYQDDDPQGESTVDFDAIFQSFEKLKQKKDFNFQMTTVEEDPPKGYIQFQYKDSPEFQPDANKATYEIKELYDDFIIVLEVTLQDYIKGKDKKFSISLFETSVYNLSAVVDSFWEKIMNLMIIKYSPVEHFKIKMFNDN